MKLAYVIETRFSEAGGRRHRGNAVERMRTGVACTRIYADTNRGEPCDGDTRPSPGTNAQSIAYPRSKPDADSHGALHGAKTLLCALGSSTGKIQLQAAQP